MLEEGYRYLMKLVGAPRAGGGGGLNNQGPDWSQDQGPDWSQDQGPD